MAKLLGLPKKGKNPTFQKGVTLQVKSGQLIAQKWPKKRGKPKSPVTREQNEWFRQANMLAKYAPGSDQWMAIEVAKGGPMYPRDLMMSAMAGRLYGKIIIDGEEYLPMAVREDVSSDLDFLAGKLVGTVIVRGPNLWQALIPSPAGLVMTSNGVGNVPSWQAVASGSGTFMVTNVPGNTPQASAFASKGNTFTVVQEVTVHSIGIRLTAVNAHTYRGSVYEIDGAGNIGAILAQTDPVTGLTAGKQGIQRSLTTLASLFPGIRYVISWSRTDGADTFVMPMMGTVGDQPLPGLPEDFYSLSSNVNNFTMIAKAEPQVGDAATISAGGRFHAKYEISI